MKIYIWEIRGSQKLKNPATELRIAMGAPRVIGAVVVCLGKALLGPFGL